LAILCAIVARFELSICPESFLQPSLKGAYREEIRE
jgi:hypothetical protein